MLNISTFLLLYITHSDFFLGSVITVIFILLPPKKRSISANCQSKRIWQSEMWRRCFPRTSDLFISIPNYSVLLQRHPTFSNHAAPTRSGINASNDGNQSHKLIFNWILNIIRISFPGNELIPELQTWLEKSVRRNKK